MLIPTTYKSLILSQTGYTGSEMSYLATGISQGYTNYLVSNPLNVIYSIGDTGAPGSGVGYGVLLPTSCNPTTLYNLINTNFIGASINGSLIQGLSKGIATATCIYMLNAQTITAHAGVGIGTTFGTIININPTAMAQSINTATGYTGFIWTPLVQALSRALVSFLLSVKFVITIAGPAGFGSTTGTGSGRLF